MVRILVSASNAERLTAAREFISSFPPSTERLLIGGSREAVDHLVREVSVSQQATFGLHRFSLTQLAARLATSQFASLGLVHSTSLGAEAVVARATFEVLERARLGYFQPVAGRPGFARALASTVNELRLASVDPASLAELEEAAGCDLAALLESVENQLKDACVADRAMLFRTAARAATQVEGDPYRLLPILMLDVPIGAAAQQDFVRALVTSSPAVLATVPLGDDVTLAALQGLPRAERMRQAGSQPDSTLRRLATYIFSEAQPPERAAGDDVCLFSAPGEGRECVEIARRILEETRRGLRFDQMAILLRAPAAYSGVLESALNRASIPSFFARGTRRPDPAGRAFLAMLACGVEHLSARRFAEYLSLGQVPNLDPSGAPPLSLSIWSRSDDESLGPAADPPLGAETPGERASPLEVSLSGPRDRTADEVPVTELADADLTIPPGQVLPRPRRDGAVGAPEAGVHPEEDPVIEGSLRAPWKWEELLVEAAVIGGLDRWARRLEGLERELRVKLETLRGEESDAARALAVERDLRNLGHLRRFALPVVDALAGFPARAHWGKWLELLEQFAPRVLRQPQRVLSVLAELRPMAAVGPVSLDEVRGVLTQRLCTLEREPLRHPYGRVFVATPEQVRGRSFEVVFVPGVAERIFPQSPREDPILLDVLRRKLALKEERQARPDVRLQTQDDRVQAERLLLRLAIGAVRSRLYLSYPRIEVSLSRPRVASFYALDVQRAVTGSIPNIEKLEHAAALESEARLAWPAPRDPSRAIDNLEHDLAILGMYRQAPVAKIKGRARYLLELNPCLARALRTRWARWQQKRWSRFDGLCELTDATAEALRGSRLRARPYSVSALQKFAICPYQFLLSAIHRLEPREQIAPLAQMDPLTRGHMFHRTQAEFMRRLQSRDGGRGLPISPSNLATALVTLDETLEEVARQYREELAPAIERVWEDAVKTLQTDLRAWLHDLAEASGEHPLWRPIHFEFGFGFRPDGERDPASIPEPVILQNGYKLHGIVDLIEQHTEVGAQGFAPLRVTDHKTGTNRTKENLIVGGGEVLQPVLYGMAVEAALRKPVSEARLYFCTPEGEFTERALPMQESNRKRGLEVLATIDRAIERAFLPPAPRERACVWCDFRDVCGPYEERRSAQKDPVPLRDLLMLRAQP
jgi:ATP-dependent helicase/nuclease subunit B